MPCVLNASTSAPARPQATPIPQAGATGTPRERRPAIAASEPAIRTAADPSRLRVAGTPPNDGAADRLPHSVPPPAHEIADDGGRSEEQVREQAADRRRDQRHQHEERP